MSRRSGDVRVIGLVAGTHILEDIARDVPHGVTVTIPGELAVRSKDLWRAISQKCIFQLPSASPPSPQLGYDIGQLEGQISDLAARLRALEAENKLLREKTETQTARKLDEIISVLQSRPQTVVITEKEVKTVKPEERVDGTAPIFLPSKLHPDGAAVVRIDVPGENASSDVIDAANRLRKMRKEKL
jgi:hypothetical protein